MRVLVVLSLFFALPLLCGASNWLAYERQGDERMSERRWDQAKSYYLRAIRELGDEAPRSLWEKYNRSFLLAAEEDARFARLRADQAAAERPAVSEDPEPEVLVDSEPALPPSTSAVASDITTGRPIIVLDLEKLLQGAQGGRMGTTGGTALALPSQTTAAAVSAPAVRAAPETPVAAVSRTPEHYWKEPFAVARGEDNAYGPQSKIRTGAVVDLASADATDGNRAQQPGRVVTPNYEAYDIKVGFAKSNMLVVTGMVRNKTKYPFHNARVYVRIYNEQGVFKGRNWSYLLPGRQSLRSGKSKRFEAKFYGFAGSLGGYKVEVIANFRR